MSILNLLKLNFLLRIHFDIIALLLLQIIMLFTTIISKALILRIMFVRQRQNRGIRSHSPFFDYTTLPQQFELTSHPMLYTQRYTIRFLTC